MKLTGFAVLAVALTPLALVLGVLVTIVACPAIALIVAAECVHEVKR